MTDPEHLDPNTLPPWMYQAAKDYDPAVLGWIAAGYLEGVKVGKKTGPCMNSITGLFGDTLVCTLHFGHLGGHSNGQTTCWTERVPDDLADPALDKAHDVREDADRDEHQERSQR